MPPKCWPRCDSRGWAAAMCYLAALLAIVLVLDLVSIHTENRIEDEDDNNYENDEKPFVRSVLKVLPFAGTFF